MVTIHPNLLVRPPYRECPGCGEGTAGVVGVSRDMASDFVRLLCPSCRWTEQRPLPAVTKRVVYIDQFAVSNMLRVAHPRHQRDGPHAEFYSRLLVQLLRLVQLQGIVCPQSSTHEQESVLDNRIASDVLALLSCLSGGVRFADRRMIENRQTVATALAWHRGQQASTTPGTDGVFYGRVNSWMPHLSIAFDLRWSPADVKILRWTKEDTVREWGPVFERWRQEPLDVMDRFREEGRGFGRSVLTRFAEREQRIRATADLPFYQNADDTMASAMCPAWNVTIALRKAAGLDAEPARTCMVEFFQSDAVLDIPFNRIKSLLFASLSRETQNGRKGPTMKRDGGTPADFGAIATSLPYCDAMFIDNKCAEYLGQQPLVGEDQKHECRIFSLKTAAQFLDYLAELEAAVPAEQCKLAEQVYGPLSTNVPNHASPGNRS